MTLRDTIDKRIEPKTQTHTTQQEVNNMEEITSNKMVNEKSEIQIVNINVDQLAIEYHPRKDLGDIQKLQGSIKRDGLHEPLLVYRVRENQYAVIDGFRRLKAVKEFGWESVPCIIKQDVTLVDAAHISYVKNTERNGFNPIEIALHLKTMRDDFGFSYGDLEIKGYGSKAHISNTLKLIELDESVQKRIQSGKLTAAHGLLISKLSNKKEQKRWAKRIIDDDLTVNRAKIQIKRYLDKGKNTDPKPKVVIPDQEIPGVYIKDSSDMSELPNESVHLIVTSPPYNLGLEYEKGVSFKEHLEMLKDVLKECARVVVPGGTIALNVGDIINFKGDQGKDDQTHVQLMGNLYQSYLKRYKIRLMDQIIWRKSLNWKRRPDIKFSNATHCEYRFLNNWEPVYIFRKNGQRQLPEEDIILRSNLTKEQWIAWTPGVWDIEPVRIQEDHPAVFPDELPRRLIRMFSYEEDTVLDPFLGSGTTVKVARELNRNGVGYEKESQYKSVIMKKLGLAQEESDSGSFQTMKESVKQIQDAVSEPFESSVEMSIEGDNEIPKAGYADGYLDKEDTA